MKLKIEELNYRRKGDVRSTAEIYSQAFAGPPWHENWPIAKALKEVHSWKKLKKSGKGKVFIARAPDGKIVGLAVGHLHRPSEHSLELNAKLAKGKKHYYLRELATHPNFLRRGIAAQLTLARLQHARRLGVATVFGRTRSDNIPKLEQFEQEGFNNFHTEIQTTGGVASKKVYYLRQIRKR